MATLRGLLAACFGLAMAFAFGPAFPSPAPCGGRRARHGDLHVPGLGRLRSGASRQRARLLRGRGAHCEGDPRRRHAQCRRGHGARRHRLLPAHRRRVPGPGRRADTQGIIIGTIDLSTGGDGWAADQSIKTVCDLKGKTIAVEPNLPARLIMQMALKKQCGLSIKDTNLLRHRGRRRDRRLRRHQCRRRRHLRAGVEPGRRRPTGPRRAHRRVVQGLRRSDPRHHHGAYRRAEGAPGQIRAVPDARSIAPSTTSTPIRTRRSRSSPSSSRSRRTTSRRRCRTSATRRSTRRKALIGTADKEGRVYEVFREAMDLNLEFGSSDVKLNAGGPYRPLDHQSGQEGLVARRAVGMPPVTMTVSAARTAARRAAERPGRRALRPRRDSSGGRRLARAFRVPREPRSQPRALGRHRRLRAVDRRLAAGGWARAGQAAVPALAAGGRRRAWSACSRQPAISGDIGISVAPRVDRVPRLGGDGDPARHPDEQLPRRRRHAPSR